mmetsp:Transcript_36512/g.37903  ORF Transcript_36512/g.37903 Transcript_36512/m.37903 type:complete len:445 (+) Transcript_36512:1-1335(+)
MEFNFNCEDALGCDNQGFSTLEGSFEKNIRQCFLLHVQGILDLLGESSSKEQGLNYIKTSANKFFSSHDRIFIKADKNVVIGFLRVGKRRIFLKDESNNYSNEEPISVIDFFVVKNYERQGYGRALFDRMLKFEKLHPNELGYDRLTPKMIKFLSKNYFLNKYIIQNNGFAVYQGFFEARKNKKSSLSEYGESMLYNPHLPKSFLHSEDNRVYMKGLRQSPNFTGGVDYRDKNRNINQEYYPNFSNNPIPVNNNYQGSRGNSNPTMYGHGQMTNTYPNTNKISNSSYPPNNYINSQIVISNRQNPYMYDNHVNNYNYDQVIPSHASKETAKPTPVSKLFGKIFLNDSVTNQSGGDSEFYSKKKHQMIKDYQEMINKMDENEFKKVEIEKRSREQEATNSRLDDIQRSISPHHSKFYEYNKKYEHKTVYDDKKILYNKANYGNYP